MRVVVYSALYGGYEEPKPLPDLGVRAIMVTDNPKLVAPGWEVQLANHWGTKHGAGSPYGPMLRAKWWKTHPQAVCGLRTDVSLYLDASMTVTAPDYVQRCLEALGDDDWVMVSHPSRSCIYDEAAYSATLPRYRGAKLAEQAAHYRELGHPERWGLFANGANVRRHTPFVLDLGQKWWQECVERTWQDQVSLPVLVRAAGDQLRWNINMPWGQWWQHSEHPWASHHQDISAASS